TRSRRPKAAASSSPPAASSRWKLPTPTSPRSSAVSAAPSNPSPAPSSAKFPSPLWAGDWLARDVEAEVADLAVADDVILAFETELTARAEVGHRAVGGDEVIVRVHLGADEPARDVRVDGAGGVLRARAAGDRPGADLVLADGEERDQPEQRVAALEKPPQGRLAQAEIREKRRLLIAGKLRDLAFDERGDPSHARVRALGEGPEPEPLDHPLAVGHRFLVEVHAVQDRLLG